MPLGKLWKDGKISVATEHLATNFLRHHLLVWMMTGSAADDRVPPTVLSCAPDEWHEGSLLIMSVLLRRRRWLLPYLGQSVPLPDLAALVRKVHAPAVVLVAMVEQTAGKFTRLASYFPEVKETGRPAIVFGGTVFTEKPEWREKSPAFFAA